MSKSSARSAELSKRVSGSAERVVCVTGGAGFLGSHLCEVLVERGDRVICLDNLHTGRTSNVERLNRSNRLHFVFHDVVNPLPTDLPCFDEIYNLACPASPLHYQPDPVRTARTCFMGATHVMERAARDEARVFHASTSEIYGDPGVHPQLESYFGNVNPVGPRSCYDEGKRIAETLITDFARHHGVAVRIARIFNTYGPRMQPDDGRVVSNFIMQSLRGDDITLYGDGRQTRSFCFVSDLIAGIVKFMATEDDGGGPVNLGNPHEVTVYQLAEMIVEMTGSKSNIVLSPLPKDDPTRRRPDISRAQLLLGWTPIVPLNEGLSRTVDYFKAHDADLGRLQLASPRDSTPSTLQMDGV